MSQWLLSDDQCPVLGLDLTCSPDTPTAYALLGPGDRVLGLGFIAGDRDILDLAAGGGVGLVALDAPLGLPLGLGCLDEPCSCGRCLPEWRPKGRACERQLAILGIGSFHTGKRSIIKKLVYRGMRLSKDLESRGIDVLEVYPYATKLRLWGRREVRRWGKKTTPRGLALLRERLGDIFPELASQGMGHDSCDALLAAHTGRLHLRGETETVGDPAEGLVVVPRPSGLR